MSDLIERLSDRAHQAWVAEKLQQNFADHAWSADVKHTITGVQDGVMLLRAVCQVDGCEIPKEKHHPDMRPYADLPDHVKEYDRVTVRAVLDALMVEHDREQAWEVEQLRQLVADAIPIIEDEWGGVGTGTGAWWLEAARAALARPTRRG